MAELVIKDVDDATLEKLAKQAEAFGRSLQEELKIILSRAAQFAEVRRSAAEMRAKLGGRHHTDSIELLREDRSR
ncbi:MAG: hypothetical protein FD138_3036 [Planctomycetota bacterium]|nr:MAG: hypothetical protein FD138_3036 [Planctomycetota bacterium]